MNENYIAITDNVSYDRYSLLGQGSYGKVYKGYDSQKKIYMAVKNIPRIILLESREIQKRQIQIMKKLNHNNVMKYYGNYGDKSNPDGLFIFLQLLEGGDLKKKIMQKLSQKQAYKFFLQLTQGMAYINSQKIFHRDLKPQNILISSKGQLKIADFGIARQISNGLNTFKRCTPVYAAPQVYLLDVYDEFQGYSQKCDVFSAGYILYFMLTGQSLTKGIQSQTQLVNFLRKIKVDGKPKIVHKSLSTKWVNLVENMLCYDPKKRPSFQNILQTLNNWKMQVELFQTIPLPRVIIQEQAANGKDIIQKITFFYDYCIQKYVYLINVVKVFSQFQQQKSQFIPRLFKILLIYYSCARFIFLINDAQKLLTGKKYSNVPGLSHFQKLQNVLHSSQYRLLIEYQQQTQKKLNNYNQYVQSFILKPVVEQITNIFKSENKLQKQTLQLFIKQIQIQKYKLGQMQSDMSYKQSIIKLINNLYQTTSQVNSLSYSDLKIYYVLLLVSKIDQFTKNYIFKQKFSMPSLQEISNLQKAQLIIKIGQLKNN